MPPTTDPILPRRLIARALIGGLALAVGGALLVPAAAAAAPATAGAVSAKAAATVAVPTVAAPRTLRQGMKGADVTALQKRLISLHYYDLAKATGTFDSATYHAVVAFQKHHGIGRDGVVGPQTRAKLAKPSTPKPKRQRGGIYYEVNLTKQVMYSFHSGSKVGRIINVSTGTGRPYTTPSGGTAVATTPTGQFYVQRKLNGWRNAPLGLLYRPAYYHGGFAVHGSYSVPTYPASHGCTRVTIATMDRIYSSLSVGRSILNYR